MRQLAVLCQLFKVEPVIFFNLMLEFLFNLFSLNTHSVPYTVSGAGYILMNETDSILIELEFRSKFYQSMHNQTEFFSFANFTCSFQKFYMSNST